MTLLPDHDPLTRFINHRSKMRRDAPHSGAFLPQTDLRLSVFRIYDLSEAEIWRIWDRDVAKDGAPVKGRADFIVGAARRQGLEVEPDSSPPRHANVIGWPPAEQKDKQKAIAMELANEATLVRPG